MNDILAGLELVLSFQNLLALSTGMVLGIVVGAIPGLTATMGIVLVLPFTYGLPADTALLLLVGIYKGGIYAGSISAILIKAPGTPASACTVIDGWPLVRQGKARKALEMSLYASCIADFLSNLALVFLAVHIARFGLRFGPPEYFWLMCFALTVVIAVSGQSLARGLVAVAVGLLLSTVGLDLVYGGHRFTFGVLELTGGLGLVPLLIGLFALPEVFNFYTQNIRYEMRGNAAGERLRWHEFRPALRSILTGSAIGVLIGAIPGTGPAVASFLSYAEAKRTSPNRREFGKGSLEGIAASEAGNNGVAGATLIPLLALGIPGDVVTAVILGAFLIHGLSIGPMLFTNHADFVYAIFIGVMFSSVVMLIAGRVAIRNFARIASVPQAILMPSVLLFCVLGTYAINNSVFDILVMLLAGVLGFAMLRPNYPVAPLLIGFILGPLLEDNLRRSLLMRQGDLTIFFRNEICWIFIVLTVVSLLVALQQRRLARKAAQAI